MRSARYEEVLRRAPRHELARGDSGFPPALRDLEAKVARIYVVGDPEVLSGDCLSVIGARRATPYGLACARMAGRVAAECGVTVVSGGACGCDQEAGRAALEAHGRTVVIPGCAADVVYPSSSADLFADAVERGGCVVSLERWGTEPRKYMFVRRNDAIAALSQALLVCEAGRPSGTFGTATTAAELGRRVYAVPGSIFSPNSRGTNWLIESGAAIVTDERALEGLVALDYGRLRMVSPEPPETRGRLMDALVASPMLPDELARHLGLDVPSTLALLTELELVGSVSRLADGRFTPSQELLVGHNAVSGR